MSAPFRTPGAVAQDVAPKAEHRWVEHESAGELRFWVALVTSLNGVVALGLSFVSFVRWTMGPMTIRYCVLSLALMIIAFFVNFKRVPVNPSEAGR